MGLWADTAPAHTLHQQRAQKAHPDRETEGGKGRAAAARDSCDALMAGAHRPSNAEQTGLTQITRSRGCPLASTSPGDSPCLQPPGHVAILPCLSTDLFKPLSKLQG